MSDSSLVISCHCPEIHSQLHHVKDGKLNDPVGVKATYVDPFSCPELKWNKIKSNSKLVVWGENCPVYFQLTNGLYYMKKGKQYEIKDDPSNNTGTSKKLFSILDESYRILKSSGRLIFGDDFLPDDIETKVEQINNHPSIKHRFRLVVIPVSESNIHLAQIDKGKLTTRKFLYIFTKLRKIGTRKSQRHVKK